MKIVPVILCSSIYYVPDGVASLRLRSTILYTIEY